MRRLFVPVLLALIAQVAIATEFHVSPSGNDANAGSAEQPFKTISAAAQVAQPGDAITVHEGTYRERVTPPRGGKSDAQRITYQAAQGERAEIKGSETVSGWTPVKPGVWKVTLPNAFFGAYNPYQDLLVGDWFDNRGLHPHTGEVYLDGKSLYESDTLEGVLDPKPMALSQDAEGSTYTWYCESGEQNTTLYANFHDRDPNKESVEINVRDACFYPDQPGRNYITVRGFRMSQAATQWAAPTAEQIGLIGTHWSKGWIIENNVISDSKCSGITLGKDRKTGHNVCINDPSKDGALHYNDVIVRALAIGWSKENIGSHIVRNNSIFHCEQTGICGSLGAAFSQIANNDIHDIWTKRQFRGAEIAGIKIHASIDMRIENNRLHNTGRGMWMDWMAQGTRISRNLCYDNTTDDLFCEVDHGPYLVDNNIFLSALAVLDMSEGGAYAHNLIAGRVVTRPELSRETPYHQAHATALAGLKNIHGGDNRFYNNIFVGAGAGIALEQSDNATVTSGYGLWGYNRAEQPVWADGNVYLNGAIPHKQETDGVVQGDFDPKLKIEDKEDGAWLTLTLEPAVQAVQRSLVTTALLGNAVVPNLPYENPDGTPLKIDTDYFGKPRNETNPFAGPFENAGTGQFTLKVR